MKVKVNRRLSAGFYHINFEVSDFTPDEVQKMASFGVPQITIQLRGGPNSPPSIVSEALNQINSQLNATFPNDAEANRPLIDCVHVADYLTMSMGFGLGGDGLRYDFQVESIDRLGLRAEDIDALADEFIRGYEEHEKLFEELAA